MKLPDKAWLSVMEKRLQDTSDSGAHYHLTLYDVWQVLKLVKLHNESDYIVAPRSPTKEMIEAGEALEHFEGGYGSSCREFWEAMVKKWLES